MTAISYCELSEAFEFVSFDGMREARALIAKDTGKIYWISEGIDEELPDDLDDEDRYIAVPHKHDLDLGGALVRRFATQEVPHLAGEIQAIFSRRGAYSRFKDLLSAEGLLDRWYAFEAEATGQALREWCADNGIEIRESLACTDRHTNK